MDNLYGYFFSPTISAGTATSVYGAYINNYGGAGTVVNSYGLYVENLTKGSNLYAVYTAGSTPSYFGGAVTVNSNVTVNALFNIGRVYLGATTNSPYIEAVGTTNFMFVAGANSAIFGW
jgi:hypothetical protein